MRPAPGSRRGSSSPIVMHTSAGPAEPAGAVLGDQNFGDVFVGRRMPSEYGHSFCSVPSYNS